MSHRQNITRIKVVYEALEELAEEVVFVGGATVSLYADRPYTETRPTEDIDILIELLNYNGYAVVEEKLRMKGFVNDIESGVICRYLVKGIIVDVMPTSDKVLGFANKWYPDAFTHSNEVLIDDKISVRIFNPVYFLATKLEAFRNRGDNDGRFSTDFEDIVFILNKRNAIWEELENASAGIKKYLKKSFKNLLSEKYFDEWISCHVDFDEQRRVTYIMGSLEEFVKQNK